MKLPPSLSAHLEFDSTILPGKADDSCVLVILWKLTSETSEHFILL